MKGQNATMPANLQKAVQSSLSAFLQQRLDSDGDIAQDVYRTLRDEANLLLERQLVCDALDTDPFELVRMSAPAESTPDDGDGETDGNEEELLEKKKNGEMIARFKSMLRVISCTRTTTLEGFSSIHAIVQLDNDGKMQGVKENIRLHFSFMREPQRDNTVATGSNDDGDVIDAEDSDSECEKTEQHPKKRKRSIEEKKSPDNDSNETDGEISGSGSDTNDQHNNSNFTPKTIITYKMDYSIDYGKMEPLLGVDIYASGNAPSVEEAIPLVNDDEDVCMDGSGDPEEANQCKVKSCNDKKCKGPEECNVKQSKQDNAEFEEIVMSDDDEANSQNDSGENGNGDRFGVFVNPEIVVDFLNRANMNLNERSVFYFFLTFPFYEHEWDICGFLLTALFDDDEDEMEEDEQFQMMKDCPTDCPGDLPCCLPCK